MAARSARTAITQDWVLETIYETAERCKQAVPVLDSEGEETGEWKFEAANVLRAAELAGKHLQMFTDKLHVDQTVREKSPNAKDENLAVLEKLPAGEVG
jgi:hypothetical protein